MAKKPFFCDDCGTRNTPDSKYCKECGAQIHVAYQTLALSDHDHVDDAVQQERLAQFLDMAFWHTEAGNTDAAVRACRRRPGDQPNSTTAHSLLGSLYEKKGDDARAVEHFERVLALNPDSEADRAKLAAAPRGRPRPSVRPSPVYRCAAAGLLPPPASRPWRRRSATKSARCAARTSRCPPVTPHAGPRRRRGGHSGAGRRTVHDQAAAAVRGGLVSSGHSASQHHQPVRLRRRIGDGAQPSTAPYTMSAPVVMPPPSGASSPSPAPYAVAQAPRPDPFSQAPGSICPAGVPRLPGPTQHVGPRTSGPPRTRRPARAAAPQPGRPASVRQRPAARPPPSKSRRPSRRRRRSRPTPECPATPSSSRA